MKLFTCKKYDFLIEKNFPSFSRLLTLRPLGSNAAEFPATQNQGKLNTTLPIWVAL